MLHFLRSYLSKEQLQVPVVQFFKENFPNLSIVKNEKDGQYEVRQKDDDCNLYTHHTIGGNLHTSLLQRLSMVYPDFSAANPSLGGVEFSNKSGNIKLLINLLHSKLLDFVQLIWSDSSLKLFAVKTSFFGVDNLQIMGFVGSYATFCEHHLMFGIDNHQYFLSIFFWFLDYVSYFCLHDVGKP